MDTYEFMLRSLHTPLRAFYSHEFPETDEEMPLTQQVALAQGRVPEGTHAIFTVYDEED